MTFFILQQTTEQSRLQHATDLVEKNRLVRMVEDKVGVCDMNSDDCAYTNLGLLALLYVCRTRPSSRVKLSADGRASLRG